MFPRYAPDKAQLKAYDFFVRRPDLLPEARHQQIMMRARYELARAAIGEPLLKDQTHDVPVWADQRMMEICSGVGAHRSEVGIVFHHQELWGIRSFNELVTAMRALLSGIQKDVDDRD